MRRSIPRPRCVVRANLAINGPGDVPAGLEPMERRAMLAAAFDWDGNYVPANPPFQRAGTFAVVDFEGSSRSRTE